MHIRTNREALVPVLNRVGGVVERRQTLPILGNLLLSAKDGWVEVVGTDLEVEIRAGFAAEVEEPGEVTVPARKVMDISRAVSEGSTIGLRVERERATIVAGRSRFALGTLPARDFPMMEAQDGFESIELEEGTLRELVEKTSFAMAQQDVRYYLNGLLLEIGPAGITAVATDGHRLAKVTDDFATEVAEERRIILPRKSVMEISRILSGEPGTLRMELSEKVFRLHVRDTVLTSKLVDGRYPDYERVIPQGADKVAVADRGALREALQRTSILSNEKYRGVRLNFSTGELRLQAHNPEQEEAEEELEIDYEQEDTAIGFNVGYLLDVLAVLDGNDVELVFSDSSSSAMVRNKGKEEETFVVMPMRL